MYTTTHTYICYNIQWYTSAFERVSTGDELENVMEIDPHTDRVTTNVYIRYRRYFTILLTTFHFIYFIAKSF